MMEVAGDAFAGGVFDEVDFEEAVGGEGLEVGEAGVGGGEEGGVVEVFVDPVGEVVEFAEVDDEAVFVELVGGEGEGDGPAVSVYAGAASGVAGLAVGERDVSVGFGTGEHFWRRRDEGGKVEGRVEGRVGGGVQGFGLFGA